MKHYLYNQHSNNGILPSFPEGTEPLSVIGLDYTSFFASLPEEDEVVFIGGDGTINYLANAIDIDTVRNRIYYLAAGTGNDFLRDIGRRPDEEIYLNDYLKRLPTVFVNGLERKFINGIGYGIDGYCCETADKIKEHSSEKINYTAIAIKGLLFHFKPKTAEITVDGQHFTYRNVWIAPTMKGRFYGGGMMMAPMQDRSNGSLTVVVYRSWSKLKALITFPSIFKGEHITKKDMVSIHTASREVEVKFSEPCALQIDGETVLNVSSYRVTTALE